MCGSLALHRAAGDFGGQAQFHALLLEDLGCFLAHFTIHAGQQSVKIFNHDHFCTKAAPNRAEFQPDHAATNDDHFFRYRLQFQRAGGIDHDLLVIIDFHTGQGSNR